MLGLPEKQAANYLKLHLLGFMIGRFAGSAIMKHNRCFPAAFCVRTVGVSLASRLCCLEPEWRRCGRWSCLAFFHSIMFPTIFALSLKHLGPHTKLGSSLLVMSIIAALFSGHHGLPLRYQQYPVRFSGSIFCHLYVLYFAARGYRPAVEFAERNRSAEHPCRELET